MTKVTTLKNRIVNEIAPALKEKLGKKTTMAVPKITKIVVNVGIGRFKEDKKAVEEIVKNVVLLSGQKPVVSRARMAISNFKLRAGQPVGICTTLRGENMYHFLNKFINVICPRIRDFRGFSERSFDGNGNLSIGIREHTVFPEVPPADANKIHGLQITFHTSATNDADALGLFRSLSFPFRKQS